MTVHEQVIEYSVSLSLDLNLSCFSIASLDAYAYVFE